MHAGAPLSRLFAATGVAAGLAGAAVWHWARVEVGGWTLYAPLNDQQFDVPTHHPGWWPSLLIFTVGGLIVGLAAGIALSKAGWTIIRSSRTDS
jgi:hypothetical protein